MKRRRMRRSAAGTTIAVLALLVLGADQFVKQLTVEHLPLERVVPVWPGILHWYHTTNSGGAFSLGAGVTWLFTLALSAVAVVIIWRAFAVRSRLWAMVLGLLLGGVLGNLGDRLFREPGFPEGHVVDMISMPWLMPAVFNVADIFIVGCMIAVALLIVLGVRIDGTREKAAPDEPETVGAATDETESVEPESAEAAPEEPETAESDTAER